jgi:hypothetical protein
MFVSAFARGRGTRQQDELRRDPSSITILLEIGGIVMTELQERMVMPFAYHM